MATSQKNTLHAGNEEGIRQGVSSVQSSTPSSDNTADQRPLWISTAKSRQATTWTNEQTTWTQFAERLAQPRRVDDVTVESYAQLGKRAQGSAKDVGGFVGGQLKDGRRRNGHVVCRSLLALDVDEPTEGTLATLELYLGGRAAVVYSTFSHRPDSPRYRAVLPLARDVSAAEYETIARAVAADIDRLHGGNAGFDNTTDQAVRFMYWPSCPSDGVPYFQQFDGKHLEPDDYLTRPAPAATTDAAATARELVPAGAGQLGDPRDKPGLVGLFCRAYDVPGAIETYLPHVYAHAGDDRYTYLAGSTEGGLVVYDGGQVAYSNHGTDPAGGGLAHCRNAFDLVRIHKFGHLDDDAAPGTHVDRLPSHRAMEELARDDDRVQQVTGDVLLSEFEGAGDRADAARAHVQLIPGRGGKAESSLTNFCRVLEQDPELQGIAYNEMTGTICVRDGAVLPWNRVGHAWRHSTDAAGLNKYLDEKYRLHNEGMAADALQQAAAARKFHPVRDYLETLPEWDKQPRLETLLVDYMGAPDNEYTRAVTRKTLVAAVARIYKPGIKFDTMLVLDGAQGIGKSTLFKKLAGQWFSDALTLADMKNKTAAEKLQGMWVLEIAELAGMRKVEVETVKSFISTADDKYRPSYGKVVESHPRQCVLVGTTNAVDGYLRDTTGNRRFWPVSCAGGIDRKPWHLEPGDVAQVWAEALHYWREGEDLYLTGELAAAAMQAQRDAVEADDRVGQVENYLNTLLPKQWETMGLDARRVWLANDGAAEEFGSSQEPGTEQRTEVCCLEVWAECFGKDKGDYSRRDQLDMAQLMAQLDGWESRDRKTRPVYGRQRVYVRTEPPF